MPAKIKSLAFSQNKIPASSGLELSLAELKTVLSKPFLKSAPGKLNKKLVLTREKLDKSQKMLAIVSGGLWGKTQLTQATEELKLVEKDD